MPPAPRGRKAARPSRPLPPDQVLGAAFERLARARALSTLVRGAVPLVVLKRLLKDALPRQEAREMPDEVWASLAGGMAVESPYFGFALAEALQDRLSWDSEPASLDEWWVVVRERPLEALWMAALSDSKAVRKEFAHIAEHCIDNYRSSPECPPPSWEFVEGLLDVQAASVRDLRDAEKRAEDADRRREAERERLEEVREELKRLRRETSELRAEKAHAEKRAESLASSTREQPGIEDSRRIDDLERRLRKADKEREHLQRELERLRGTPPARSAPPSEPAAVPATAPRLVAETAEADDAGQAEERLAEDPNARRRVIRLMLRKLMKKGKIGASHTHEDNVYRGVADHEKGLAKEAMDILYREGLLVPKPTVTDPHVSLSPERINEVKAIIAGDVANLRLQRFIEG